MKFDNEESGNFTSESRSLHKYTPHIYQEKVCEQS